MDKALKERKLASASVRKQRMQERQRQKDLLHEQREERRRRQLRYSEIYVTDSAPDTSRSNTPENDSAAETPSEYSVRTPDHSFSPDVEITIPRSEMSRNRSAKKEEEQNHMPKPTLLERRRSKSNTAKPGMLGPSLNRLCDFRYDRYSTVIEPIDTQSETEDDDSSSGEDEENYSPIEVARPVAIRTPISRPSVISVTSSGGSGGGPSRFSVKNIDTIMVNPPRPAMSRLRQTESVSEARLSISRKASGFLASEAKPLEVATPSSESVISLEPPSVRSLSPVRQEARDNNLKKKSSMDMLGKFTHTRMHSIKNFMKTQSISGPPPAMPQIPAAHQSRPSANADTMLSAEPYPKSQVSEISNANKHRPVSPWRSVTEPVLLRGMPQEQRPQTARVPSQSSITPLPTTSTLPSSSRPETPVGQAGEPAADRKMSFANLRRRSGSLGQALKLSSGRNQSPGPEAPMPPVPMVRVPTRDSVQSLSLPTPPKTPRSVRKSGMMMYSPFPPANRKGEPVGLGLRV